MKTLIALSLLIFLGLFSFGTETNGVLKSIHASYKGITSLMVEMRRTTELQNGKSLRTLSTVYFKRDDKFHSETVSPIHRRVIADGVNFRMYIDESPYGVKSPVEKLPQEMLANMRAVPGSPESFLMAFSDAEEEVLPLDDSSKTLVGLLSKDGYGCVEISEKGCVLKFSVYATKDMNEKRMEVEFSDYIEPVSGVWLPKKHVSTFFINGKGYKDVLKLVNLSVNEEIADSIFNHDAYFSGVSFENL